MLYTTGVLARGCHLSGKFYGESSRVQFQNANFQRRFTQILEKNATERKTSWAK